MAILVCLKSVGVRHDVDEDTAGGQMKDIESIVSSIIKDVLGTEPPNKDIPLSAIGMDSIDALDLFYTLEERFDVPKLVSFGGRYNPAITQREIEDRVKALIDAVS